MNLLEMLEAAGRAATSMAAGPEGTPNRIWSELSPWVIKLTQSAAGKWLPALIAEIPCQVPHRAGATDPCARPSVAACDVCRRPVCLHHGRVDYEGGLICIQCVAEMIRLKRGGAPPPHQEAPRPPPTKPTAQQIRAAYKLLGVTAAATDAELKSAYKRKSAVAHPDRNRAPDAEERFKAIQAAYDLLKQVRGI